MPAHLCYKQGQGQEIFVELFWEELQSIGLKLRVGELKIKRRSKVARAQDYQDAFRVMIWSGLPKF